MENIFNQEYGIWLWHTLSYILNASILFFIGRSIFNQLHRKINVAAELVEKDNFAFALANVGYYIGLLIAIGGTVIGQSYGLQEDLINITVFGLLSILLLNLASWVNDTIILRNFSIHKELIRDENAGTGIIEAANYIASGLIIFGAVSGEAANFFPDSTYGIILSGVISMFIFWVIGQLLLLLTAYVYNVILPYDVHDEIEKDNVAAGIGYAGAMIAIAHLIGYGTGGDFLGWGEHLVKILFDVTIGLLLLPFMRWLTDWILLPGAKLTDEIVNQEFPNKGAALIEAFAYIGSAVLLTWCM